MDVRQQRAIVSQNIWNEFEKLSPSQKKAIRQVIIHAAQLTGIDFKDFHQYSDIEYSVWVEQYIEGRLLEPHGAFADLGAIEIFVSEVLEVFIDDQYFQQQYMPENLQEVFALYVELNRYELIEEGSEEEVQDTRSTDEIFIQNYRAIQNTLNPRWVIEAENMRTGDGKFSHIDAYFFGKNKVETSMNEWNKIQRFRQRHIIVYTKLEPETQLLLREAIIKTTYEALEQKILRRMSSQDIELGTVSQRAVFNEFQRFVLTGVSQYPILEDALELFHEWVESENMEVEQIEWTDILGIYVATAHRDEHARLDFVTGETVEPADIDLNVFFSTPSEWNEDIVAVALTYDIQMEGYDNAQIREDESTELPFELVEGAGFALHESSSSDIHDATTAENNGIIESTVIEREGVLQFPLGGKGRRK